MRASVIIASLLTGLIQPIPSPAQVNAELFDLVYIAGGKVILGQIASLSGDPEAIEKIRDLQIGKTMRRTESRVLSVEEIKRALPPEFEVYFFGAPAVEVRPLALPGEFCDIQPLLQRRFARLAGDSITVRITELGRSDPLDPPESGPVGYRVMGEQTLTSGKQIVSLDRHDGNGPIRRIHCEIELTLFARLAFTARRLGRGQAISPADVIIRTAELGPSYLSGLVYRPERIVGWEATRAISADTPLRWRDLRAPTAVREGDGVELIIQAGAAQIKAIATALQSGSPGERIWIRLDENGKRLQARVVEGGIVMLE
ncbi:MAG TPA: flagellar basal body P-ring formation chaperone FlgA [bacterium]|jgi:flagella basal body P-ring formation protein FlgA